MAANSDICDFGWKIQDAELIGTDDKRHRILNYMGDKGMVVAFICNHCPYVKAVIDRIIRDAEALKDYHIGFVLISSNDVITYPEDSFDNMKRFAQEHHFTVPYLFDESQEVARSYHAVCTPDFFGFNHDGELQYRGRLDGSRKETCAEHEPRELFEAMKLVAETGRGPQEQNPSIGCSIKWKNDRHA